MGLISRVSSRTYRKPSKMVRKLGNRKDAKSNLGSALQTSGKKEYYKPKKERAEAYRQVDDSEAKQRFTQFQDNMVSITEQNDLQAFMDHAVLQNRNFETERTRMQNLLIEK